MQSTSFLTLLQLLTIIVVPKQTNENKKVQPIIGNSNYLNESGNIVDRLCPIPHCA